MACNNTEIAEKLNISVRTVKHTTGENLMQKLEVNTVVDLLKQASKYKIIDL
ncbi:MAG: LuxR C-terminal-related transcriptional regulator [Bacteroidales bacterium]|nr:LuxR C-terminal-related transcriptional regulator [Bacteroidales bacterium]